MSATQQTAVITGITGQDGAYLTKLLLSKNYKVVGTTRTYNPYALWRLEYLGVLDPIEIVTCNTGDPMSAMSLLLKHKPTEIYNLAAQSSVSLSFDEPASTLSYNIRSVVNILESIRILDPSIKLYQASTSEMFGNAAQLPVNESTPFDPINPYATSKAAAHWTVRNYREAYDLYCCSGILFNHESFLRSPRFFTKQIIQNAIDIAAGRKDKLLVGNIDVRRDFGCAKEYVVAMWLMLQQEKADDFVVCSGKSVSLREVTETILDCLEIPHDVIQVDPKLYRPSETRDIYGDNKKARTQLNWHYDKPFSEVIREIVTEELAQAKRD